MTKTKPIEKDDVLKHLDQVLAKKRDAHNMDTMTECTTGAMGKKIIESWGGEEKQKRITSVIVHGISESKEKESEHRVEEDESMIAEVLAAWNSKQQ